jgi:hypothetical protein
MKLRIARAGCAAAALGASLLAASVRPVAAQTQIVYANGFSQGAGGGTVAGGVSATWSNGPIDVAPSGRYGPFLGRFGNDAVTLTLTGLPPHRSVTLSLKLFIIDSWDGNDSLPGHGPDFWEFGVGGGPGFLRTTFANVEFDPNIGHIRQSYPGAYPSSYPARTGALERNTLGYGGWGDSVYAIGRSFAHRGSSLTLYFAGRGQEGIWNESWGLDDVSVAVSR